MDLHGLLRGYIYCYIYQVVGTFFGDGFLKALLSIIAVI
jgi:hypothetical protein